MRYGEDFLIMDISYPVGSDALNIYPCKFDGSICLYCLEGAFSFSIGMEEYDIRKDCFAVTLPGDIITLKKVDVQTFCKIRMLMISDILLQEMGFDISVASVLFRYRMVKANLQYKVLIYNFRNIFRSVIITPRNDTKKSLACLLRSMYYELTHIWESLASAPKMQYKLHTITEAFVALVAKNHVEHRDIRFYAEKLGVTAKYLSIAVKKASKQTALEWITSYVILEAKFYLKHTHLHIKEIAYTLNFANQMDFYRYFLRHAGMSPTKYKKME